MPADVDYVNLALNNLGADQIVALAISDSKTAKIALPIYNTTVEWLLAKTSWRGATTRHQLSKLTTKPPVTEYAYEYALPNETLRVVKTDRRRGDWMLYRDPLTGYRRLYSNRSLVSADLVLRPDSSLFPAHFQEALVAQLTANLALPITRRADIKVAMDATAKVILSAAITQDWNEQPWPEIDDGDWLRNAKYGGSAGTPWPDGWEE